jgi:predicted DNA-binding transcriptional regulator YafY
MSETALDRVARSLDLIPYILSHPGSSLKELASVFNTSILQISKDLSLLHMCGLPGYSHLELLDINYEDPEFIEVSEPQVLDQPRKLSRQEAIALVLGLQRLQNLSHDEEMGASISNLIARIAGTLGDEELYVSLSENPPQSTKLIEAATRAIQSSETINISYTATETAEISEREIFPTAIEFHRGFGYLIALDCQKRQMRTFRLDRIVAFSSGNPFERSSLSEAEELNRQNVDPTLPSERVHIELDFRALPFIEDHQAIIESSLRTEEGYQIEVKPVNEEWLLRSLMGVPGKVRITNSSILSKRLRTMVEESLIGYA